MNIFLHLFWPPFTSNLFGCICTYTRAFLFFLTFVHFAHAQPASLPFDDCTSGDAFGPSQRINISTVYGQIVPNEQFGKQLNLVALGNAGQTIEPISNDTGLLSTLFTTSTILSINIWQNSTFFCSTLRPPSPLPELDPNSTTFYCPVAAGPVAFSAVVPFKHDYELMTITSRLRVVDTSVPAIELACVDVFATPLSPRKPGSPVYGPVTAVFWASVALVIGYWVVVGLARIVAAWGRGRSGADRSIWSRLEGAGFILASAISGERFAHTPALLRFGTPSMRDVVFHTQWCTALGMLALQWPFFTYTFFAQTAWSTLLYNITITQGSGAVGKHWDVLAVQNFTPPSEFADQLGDIASPIFLNDSTPNSLFLLPADTPPGIASLAYTIGLRPRDLFGICVSLFLCIIAGVILLSLIIWGIDRAVSMFMRDGSKEFSRSAPYINQSRDGDKLELPAAGEDGASNSGHVLVRASSIPLSNGFGRSWWRHRIRPNSFHGSILHGNLVRILILFHLPITIFSSYQFSSGKAQSSLSSVVLAVFTFAIFSIILPAVLILRLSMTATNRLYDRTRTLMMLGPLYNHYAHGSQLFACMFFATNLLYGLTIGCGQKSGTAQAIIILVVEVGSSLGTSVWLPWGRGASMGLISFFYCVARITVAVLLVILTPTVAVGDAAGGWVATAILFILGVMYLWFLLILVIKVLEGIVRILWRIPFDRSSHTIDSGLFGVLGLTGCCGTKRRRKNQMHQKRKSANALGKLPSSVNGSHQFAIGKGVSPRSSTASPLPFREDTDDDSGYIMGSWQPFPQPGYALASNVTPSEETPPKTGFARIGGGRAHYDSPYSIAQSGRGLEFPSTERLNTSASASARASPNPTAPIAPRYSTADTPSNRSTVTVNHQVSSGLPPGAMSPQRPSGHVRTKSQTAVVEDASVLFAARAAAANTGSSGGGGGQTGGQEEPLQPPPQFTVDTDDSSSDATMPKRNHWYTFRRNRRMSDGNVDREIAQAATSAIEGDNSNNNSGSNGGGNGGRSFVVFRAKRPGSAGNQQPSDNPSSGSQNNETEGQDGRRSFVVLRNNTNSTNANANNAGSSSSRPPLPINPSRSSRRSSFA